MDMWTTQERCPHAHSLNNKYKSQARLNQARTTKSPTDSPEEAKKEETMKQRVAAILVTVASTGLVFAQQPSVPKTGMETDLPEVVAEVKAAYDRYNNAINSGTIAVLNGTFWNDPRTIRYGQAENLYGYIPFSSETA